MELYWKVSEFKELGLGCKLTPIAVGPGHQLQVFWALRSWERFHDDPELLYFSYRTLVIRSREKIYGFALAWRGLRISFSLVVAH